MTPAASDEIVQRHRGLVRRTVLVSALTFVSRILGFVREVLSAALFGDTSAIYDAFVTAWRVPNLFRRFLGEGAISTALQTALTEVDGDAGNEAGRRLFLRTLALMTGILTGLCAVVMALVVVTPDVMPGTGWAWLGADPEPVRELCLRLMPFVVLVCLAALCGGALQVRGHFGAPAVAPALQNVAWIAALVGLGVAFGWEALSDAAAEKERQFEMARWLAWGVLAAGVVQLGVHVPALLRQGLLFRAAGVVAEAGAEVTRSAWGVLRTSAPLALGAAVYQVNVMLDGLMAEGLLRDGGPAAHYYANRIQQFPLALVAIAATSSVFPSLKALGHRGRLDELRALHDRTQFGVVFLALPAGAGLLALSHPMCAVLFQHGEYGADGVGRMSAVLTVLAVALIPAGAVGLASRVYYAVDDLRTPVRISIAMLVLNALLNVAFVVGIGMDADGLALATALTSWGNLFLLLPGLSRRLGLPSSGLGVAGVVRRLAPIVIASTLAAVVAWLAQRGVATLLDADEPERSVPGLVAAAAVGVGSYLLLVHIFRVPEWTALRARLAARRRAAPPQDLG